MSDVGSSQPVAVATKTEAAPRSLPVIAVWARDLLVSLAISAFIIIFLYQPVKVEGTSMMPGLEDQERIFVNKFVYRWEPISRGDIVVFRYPRDTTKSYIKRVIGVAGDRRSPLRQWRRVVPRPILTIAITLSASGREGVHDLAGACRRDGRDSPGIRAGHAGFCAR